ncbi:MAG: serine hydrolase domain-containing protein [Candidatus Limnocylindrales bacterium]
MPTTITAELSSALQATVRSEMARIGAPGMSVAIRLPSGELWTGVSGFAAFSPDRPVTRKTVFAIASITKTFVASLIMKLAEDGVLTIDDPLADYLPDFRRARRITLRMLLAHTSGVFDYFTSAAYAREVFADTTRRWTFDEILGFVGPSYCRPGECYHYSNTNFVLLGRVAELATGEPIAQLLRERLFDPAGLTRTIFQPDATTPLDAAHGFLTNRRGFVDHTGESRVIPHMSAATVAWSAGAIASTPSDLALWATSLYGGHVLAPESLAQMLTFRPDDDYGLGTRLHIYRGRTCVGHTGSIRGFANEMWYFPDDGVSIVMLQNRGKILTHNVIKAILGTLTGVTAAP